jgi:Tfp pilus assembly protein PilF
MHMHSTHAILLALVACLAVGVGCTDKTKTYRSGGYRTVEAPPDRDTETAKRYNAQGLEHLGNEELDEAAADFRRSLVADVTYGPAHNNLGKVFYAQKDWYQAAWEFDYARELMPRQPEPLNNLGLVHEQAGELDRAVENYQQAVALGPDRIEYRANLARAKVRRGDADEELISLLQQILDQDSRPEWLVWAKPHLLRLQSGR